MQFSFELKNLPKMSEGPQMPKGQQRVQKAPPESPEGPKMSKQEGLEGPNDPVGSDNPPSPTSLWPGSNRFH